MKPYSFDSFDQSSALRTKTKISYTYYTFIIEIKNNYIKQQVSSSPELWDLIYDVVKLSYEM